MATWVDTLVDEARQKIGAIRGQIAHLAAAEHVHDAAKVVLQKLDALYANDSADLAKLDSESDPDIVRACCRDVNIHILKFHKLLGIVLRSTNVRNAFEV